MHLKTVHGTVPRFQDYLAKRASVKVGPYGEWLSLCHLRKLGWDIVARNWPTRRGEVDLIAFDDRCLVFIEVKTRKPSLLPPEFSVDEEKSSEIIPDRSGSVVVKVESPDQAESPSASAEIIW